MGCGSSAAVGVADPANTPAKSPTATGAAAAAAANGTAKAHATPTTEVKAFAAVTPGGPADAPAPAPAPSAPAGGGGGGGLPGLSGGSGPSSDLTALMQSALSSDPSAAPAAGSSAALLPGQIEPTAIAAGTAAAATTEPSSSRAASRAGTRPGTGTLRSGNAVGADGPPTPAGDVVVVPAMTAAQFSDALRALLSATLPFASGVVSGRVSSVALIDAVISYSANDYRVAVFTEDAHNHAFVYRLSWAPPPLLAPLPTASTPNSPASTAAASPSGSTSAPPTPRAVPGPVVVTCAVERKFPAYTPAIADSDHQPYPLLSATGLPEGRVACLCSNGTPVQVWDTRAAVGPDGTAAQRIATLPSADHLAAGTSAAQAAAKANAPRTTGRALVSGRAAAIENAPKAVPSVVTNMLCLPRHNRLVLAYLGGAIKFYSTATASATTAAAAGAAVAAPTTPSAGPFSELEDMAIHVKASGRASGSGGVGVVHVNGGVVTAVGPAPDRPADPDSVRITAMVMLAGSSHSHSGHVGAGGATTTSRAKDVNDPRLVWIDSFDHLRAWNTRTKRLVYTARVPGIWPHALVALRSHRLAIATDEVIRLYSTELRIVPLSYRLTGHTKKVVALAVMPDGLRLVSGSADATIRVWDTAHAYKASAVLEGHTGTVLSVAPLDADRIVSFAADQTLRVWDLATASCVLVLPCPNVRAIAIVRG